ncbi:phenylacetate--CoA ligase [Nitriliruptoraceae bacterium ZYF776]|nr:phenylacetate--CoA ligase [Profundirhabdus halotolerans]
MTSKERLLEMQRETPPFGGFLGIDLADLQHVFVSPGPLFDPQGAGQRGLGFQHAFAAAGIGPDDIVLNTWSYHLVPAGLAMDEALTDLGATVIPGGVGNTEQQAQLVVQLGVTAISASTGFFVALAEKLEELGYDLPADWNVEVAFLGGEFGDWMAKRRRIEERYRIRTTSAYATGDLGTVGFECEQQDGYHLTPDLIVQVCDPDTDAPLPDGEVGHIVATAFNDAYPLVRFGTGDLSMIMPDPCPCGRDAPRLAPLQGRVGLAVKAREIFVYPLHVTDLTARVDAVTRAQAVVRRPDAREEILLRVELADGADEAAARARIEEEFRALTRLGVDDIEVLPAGTIAGEEPFVMDHKDT